MKLERTKNAKRNIAFGLVNKAVTLILPFVIRMVIIRQIGAEYLGLDSLFASILQILNLTELGFSSAVIYSMYRPIAENDTDTLCAILRYYRRIYSVIGTIIFAAGLALLPFLPKLIHGTYPETINLYVLYLIYLLNTAISYWLFAYKSSLLNAYQRQDVISIINTAVRLCTYLLQIILLVITHNYYFYAVALIFSSVATNICTAVLTKKMYPHLFCRGQLVPQVRKDINIKVKGLLIEKICTTSRNAFDSVFVSAFLGLTQTAMYNNYYYVLSGVTAILSVFSQSIQAGVGNSIATETVKKNYDDMTKINFAYMVLSGICASCLLCLSQPFMLWSFKDPNLLFPLPTLILFCGYFYLLKMGDIRSVYAEANGLWWFNRHRSVCEAVANVILNYVLGRFFGVNGIIAATMISLFVFNFLWGSNIIFRQYYIGISIREYFLTHGLYAVTTLVSCTAAYLLCIRVPVENLILNMGCRLMICGVVAVICYFAAYHRTKYYKMCLAWVRGVIHRA